MFNVEVFIQAFVRLANVYDEEIDEMFFVVDHCVLAMSMLV